MPRIRLALGQTNPIVADLAGNSRQIIDVARRAAAQGADLFAVGEMALSGYPIEDLASRPSFLADSHRALRQLAEQLNADGLGDLAVIVGHPDGPFEPQTTGTNSAPTAIAQNCASVIQHGQVLGRYAKHHLPNYSVFDEYRNFIAGHGLMVCRLRGVDVAVIVCEDLWRESGPVSRVAEAKAGLLLVINASPFERDKNEVRLPLVVRRGVELGASVAYVNLVGGQDDLVFDGDSVVVDGAGLIVARAPQFAEHLLVVDLELAAASDAALPEGIQRVNLSARDAPIPRLSPDIAVLPEDREQVWNALVLGLRDYVQKNGFRSVILGLSGGIDSAVCAAIACDAIGAERVWGVSMPSRYSSDHSRSDADELAENLGLNFSTEAIADLVLPVETQLKLTGTAAENLQARIRGIVLMGLSNLDGHLVLTTGNKTELSVGYSTIYGDSAGGFAPIKDVPKTLVWELARWRNAAAVARDELAPIPVNSIEKPPSAELRPDQTDEDSLPPYELLDEILNGYITRKLGREELVTQGFDPETVEFVAGLVDRSEWKRRQGAIGPKISGMAFGRDRRLPITHHPSR